MPRSKSPLWLSVTLLIFTYAIFGWLAATWREPSRWAILVTLTILSNIISVQFERVMNTLLQGLFGASMRSLFVVMGFTTFLAIILTQLPIFAYTSLVLAVALLLSIDLYDLGLNRLTNFMLLVICQMIGLGLGFGSNIFWWRAVHYWQYLHP